jgi:pimeloyl-ACP methyl ester carboxylesterase
MSPRHLAITAALALAALAPQSAHAALKLPECATGVECGTYKVPLDHAGKVKGSIALAVTRYRARKAAKAPIFAFAGGPGQAAGTVAETFANEDLKAVRTDRDLIVFDQRGTGGSGAIDCPALQKDVRDLKAQASCAKQLGARRPFYTTPDSVEDVEAVRRAIGAPKIALFGVSYGTAVAVQYALRYPSRVDRLVLDSVVQPEGQTVFEEDAIAALPRVLRAECAGRCGTSDIAADFATAVAAMPLRGTYVDARGRRRGDTFTARDLFDFLRGGDLDPLGRSELPAGIAAAARGDAGPLLRLRHRLDAIFADDTPVEPTPAVELSSGLFAATVCEEAQLPWDRTTPLAERPALARDRALGQGSKLSPFDAATVLDGDNVTNCLAWPQSPAPPKVGAGPLPDVPVLLFEGEEDLRTPLEAGRSVADRFPRSRLVVVPNQGHSVVGAVKRCAQKAIRTFFADRKAGNPCAKNPAPADVVPLAPQSVTPTPQGAADAAAATLTDLGRERALLDQVGLKAAGGGLRAGRFAQKGKTITLTGLSYAPGLSLTGTVSLDARTSGTLKVASGPRSGSLTLKNGVLTGTLANERVRATVATLRIPPPLGARAAALTLRSP